MDDDLSSTGRRQRGPTSKGQKKGQKRGRVLGIAILCIVLAIVLVAFATLSVQADLPPEPGVTYPYTVTYSVLVPEGKTITIAGMDIVCLESGNELIMKIGNETERLSAGDTRTISERRALFQTLGIEIFSSNYRIEATYRGMNGSLAEFYLVIRTSSQVPSSLIRMVLPPEIQAEAIESLSTQ